MTSKKNEVKKRAKVNASPKVDAPIESATAAAPLAEDNSDFEMPEGDGLLPDESNTETVQEEIVQEETDQPSDEEITPTVLIAPTIEGMVAPADIPVEAPKQTAYTGQQINGSNGTVWLQNRVGMRSEYTSKEAEKLLKSHPGFYTLVD